MAKPRVTFLCCDCGSTHSSWMGRCPDCGAWDTLERYVVPSGGGEVAGPGPTGAVAAVPLPEVEAAAVERWSTGIGEFDRVLGGGIVPGSVILFGGEPGIGKSTLLLQAAASLAGSGRRVLYVSSEESAFQTRLRAERLLGRDLDTWSELLVLADTQLERITEQVRKQTPAVAIIDSIQMLHSNAAEAAPGSVTQVRRCCTELVRMAKTGGMAIVVVGHVTKDGQLAGPRLLEHLVDAVLSFEGDRHHAHRVVRGTKNRFGTTLEVGLFEMTERGLMEVLEPGIRSPDETLPAGSVLCPVMHGSRSLMVEVQALTATGFLGNAKRRTSGLDPSRLAMLIAVLEKHGGMRLADQDVFVSAVGGLRVAEPGADLAVALAIAGTHLGRALGPGVVALGEVGLGGEVRAVPHLEARVGEAVRRGFRTVITAENPPAMGANANLVAVRTIADAIDHLSVPHRSLVGSR